jgi:glycosyltransferase involved in cell wall biosynthesis
VSPPGVRLGATVRVSVVMPTRNALPYLDDSVGSIVGQSFEDIELIILDDASTDGSADALRAWARRDGRIRLYRSAHGLGPAGSANFVVRQARSAFVARMDADDVSHPDRLRRQFEVMTTRPDVALVGALSDGMDAAGRLVRPRDRWRLVRHSSFAPFPHGSTMFRRRVFEEVGGYREPCAGWEDQDLFLRMSQRGRILVLPDVLYHYRYRRGSVSLTHSTQEAARIEDVRRRCLAERRAGHDYAALLASPARCHVTRSATRAALRSAGALELWAGHRPRLFRRMLHRDIFEWNPAILHTLMWSAWAGASPGSLRFIVRSVVRGRDFLASFRLKDGRAYEWRFR